MNYLQNSNFRNRRGAAIVFLMILFASLASMLSIFIHVSRQNAVDAAVKSLGRIWGTSILAEYDLNLYERYHIMAYYGRIKEVEDKLDFYIGKSLKEKAYVKYDDIYYDPFDYALTDIDVFKKALKETSISANLTESPGSIPEAKPYKPDSDRKILNKSILRALPSYGREDRGFIERIKEIIRSVRSLENFLQEGSVNYNLLKYIKNHFYNARRLSEEDDGFFRYEEEYIICGKDSDLANLNGVKRRIIGVREVMNLMYIESDPDMQAKILAMAELTGPVTPAAQQAIGAAWALIESVNDYRLLINGEKVPLRKDKQSWASDIESISEGMEEGYINPGNKSGNTYEDYLLFFIYFMKADVKYLRLMDLIQINMKYCYYSDFLLEDYFTGLYYEFKVNRKLYRFENAY